VIRRWGSAQPHWWGRRGERGGSQSILLLGVVVVLVLSAGLVVDGGQKTAAARDAEAVAAGAARAGLNAAATGRLAGRANTTAAVSAARSFLAGAPDVSGSVQLLPGGRLRVTTQSTQPTRYLSLIGITTVTGRGEATAELIESGGG
jgi:hypothetical protein